MPGNRTAIVSSNLPAAIGPYSYGMKAGDWFFTAGMMGIDAGGKLVGRTLGRADVEAQTRQALQNLDTVLQELNVGRERVLKVNGYLSDMRYLDRCCRSYRDYFRSPHPALSIHGKALPVEDAVVVVDAIGAVSGMPREIISKRFATPQLPSAQGGTQVGHVLFSSGHCSFDLKGALIGRGDMRVQTEQALDNIAVALGEAGLDFSDVIKINVTIPDWYSFHKFNEVYLKYFQEPFPARAVIQGNLHVEGLLVEIEVVAAKGKVKRTVDSHVAGGSRFTLKRRADTIYLKELFPTRSPYAHAVQVDDLVYLCGQIGFDASNHLVGPGDIRAQTRKTMENHRVCLEALGFRMEDIVKTLITVTDHRLIEGFNEEYAKFFSPPYPVQSTVIAGLAREHMVLEIEGVAVLGASQSGIAVTGPAR